MVYCGFENTSSSVIVSGIANSHPDGPKKYFEYIDQHVEEIFEYLHTEPEEAYRRLESLKREKATAQRLLCFNSISAFINSDNFWNVPGWEIVLNCIYKSSIKYSILI